MKTKNIFLYFLCFVVLIISTGCGRESHGTKVGNDELLNIEQPNFKDLDMSQQIAGLTSDLKRRLSILRSEDMDKHLRETGAKTFDSRDFWMKELAIESFEEDETLIAILESLENKLNIVVNSDVLDQELQEDYFYVQEGLNAFLDFVHYGDNTDLRRYNSDFDNLYLDGLITATDILTHGPLRKIEHSPIFGIVHEIKEGKLGAIYERDDFQNLDIHQQIAELSSEFHSLIRDTQLDAQGEKLDQKLREGTGGGSVTGEEIDMQELIIKALDEDVTLIAILELLESNISEVINSDEFDTELRKNYFYVQEGLNEFLEFVYYGDSKELYDDEIYFREYNSKFNRYLHDISFNTDRLSDGDTDVNLVGFIGDIQNEARSIEREKEREERLKRKIEDSEYEVLADLSSIKGYWYNEENNIRMEIQPYDHELQRYTRAITWYDTIFNDELRYTRIESIRSGGDMFTIQVAGETNLRRDIVTFSLRKNGELVYRSRLKDDVAYVFVR